MMGAEERTYSTSATELSSDSFSVRTATMSSLALASHRTLGGADELSWWETTDHA